MLTPSACPAQIACDESGAEGEKLIGGNSDVFAHASVSLGQDAAAGCIQVLRERIRSPALEYKANHLLRPRNRAALIWLLGAPGPLGRQAHVHLTDKTFFLIRKMMHLLLPDGRRDSPAGATALTFFREGQAAFGPQAWQAFLGAFNDLVRARNSPPAAALADEFFWMAGRLRRDGRPGRAAQIMDEIWRAGPRAPSLLAQQPAAARDQVPVLDPLIPAIARAVAYWSAGGRLVAIVHDRQVTLTPGRVARLREIIGAARPAGPAVAPGGPLASFTLVDSRLDPRVQVADFVAGVARKIASDALGGRGDAELTALLAPYVDELSVWGAEAGCSS